VGDVRLFISWLINQAVADEIPIQKASKPEYLANILKSIIVNDHLEKRIAELEEKLN